jgi:hypothetical protein
MSFLKKVFWLGVFSVGGYFGYKFYRRIKSLSNLHNTLPQYLENIIGEAPKQKINLQFNKMVYDLWFTAETIEKNPNLEEMIREYIDDFYPAFKGMNIEININEKNEETEDEKTSDENEEIKTEEEHTEDDIES